MLQIRKAQDGEERQLLALLRNTVHQVNSRDYTPQQINAWAPDDLDTESVCARIKANQPYVALLNGKIVAFADLQRDGYIDQFFCHHEHVGQGIGKQLFSKLLQDAAENHIHRLYANVSITARPFFLKQGFLVERQQEVSLRGQQFTNYRMVLTIQPDK